MAFVRGGPVRAHVQAFADAVLAAGWAGPTDFGTYADHQPTRDRALDVFTPTNSSTRGDAICRFALQNWNRYGITYVIYRQRINSNDGRGWRGMENRGSPSANHYDHVHISFEPTATAGPIPVPTPNPQEDELTPEEKAALGRIEQRTKNVEDAVARFDPEVFTVLDDINRKLDRLLAQHPK